MRFPKVNKRKIIAESAFNRDPFMIEDNDDSNKDEKSLFLVFLQIHQPGFNPYTEKYV